MRKKTYQVSIIICLEEQVVTDIIYYVLENIGISHQDIVEEKIDETIKLSVFMGTEDEVRKTTKKIKALKLKGIIIKTHNLYEDEWKNKWKEAYKPFNITSGIKIVPLFMKNKEKWEDSKTIFIDTDIVFGSGLHPTTRMVAGFMELNKTKYKSFFDVGTGTGILTILAHKYGAAKLWAIDISREAVKIAKKNFKINNCIPELINKTDFNKFQEKEKFDFVAANILSLDLIEMRDKMLSYVKKGKYLAVSGVSTYNYEKFRDGFDSNKLKCLRVKKSGDWSALLYEKK